MKRERVSLEYVGGKSYKSITPMQWVHLSLTIMVVVGTLLLFVFKSQQFLDSLSVVAILCSWSFVLGIFSAKDGDSC